MGTPSCEVVEARKVYGVGAGQVVALDSVSLAVAAGDFVTLAGPSGSGKTTLLNMIGLLDAPDSGSVRIEGAETSGLTPRALASLRAARIGFVFQSFNLVPVLSAAENVELALQLSGRPWPDASERVAAVLEAVGLGGLGNRRPAQLSGGQQQRVAVARALVKDPAIVLADEPTANLDSATADQILDLMAQMNADRGVTFVFSTHDPRVIARARRVVRLRDGQIVEIEDRA